MIWGEYYNCIAFNRGSGQENRKTWKSRREEKVVGFGSASLSLARRREAVTRVETGGG